MINREYFALKDEIDQAVKDVLVGGDYIRSTESFERSLSDYVGAKAVTCGNGTDALQLALMALDLKKGDKVITTPFTFVSTLEVIVLLGLTPVLADVYPDTYNINLRGNAAKAVIPVHLFGLSADMGSITGRGMYVIEDACQALGEEYKGNKVGSIGDIGVTSFFPTKNLGGYGDGGAVFSDEYADKIRMLANHGQKEKYRYEHIGINSRLDRIQSAILEVKLKYLDSFIAMRRNIADLYFEGLRGLDWLQLPVRSGTFNQFTIRTKYRDELKKYLSSVGARVYYPVPLHLQPAYKFMGFKKGDFSVSEMLSETVLSLPIHPFMERKEVENVIRLINDFA